MATTTLKTVAANTAPPLLLTARRGTVAIDLTGCTVNLIITKGGVQTNTGHTGCTIVTPLSGIVSYVRQAGDLSLAGDYICDLEVVYPDSTEEILYDQLKLKARKRLIS